MKTLYDNLNNFINKNITDNELREFTLFEFSHGYQNLLNMINKLNFKGENVLDVGCGVGNWSIPLSEVFKKVVAIDKNRERLKIAKKIFKHFNLNITTKRLDIEKKLPFKENSFDLIFCNGVIFLTNYKKTINNLIKYLKPNGFLYFTFNEIGWWKFLINHRMKFESRSFKKMVDNQILNSLKNILDQSNYDSSLRSTIGLILLTVINNLKHKKAFFRIFFLILKINKIISIYRNRKEHDSTEKLDKIVDKWKFLFKYAIINFDKEEFNDLKNVINNFLNDKFTHYECKGGFFISYEQIREFISQTELKLISILKQNDTLLNADFNESISKIYEDSKDIYEVICMKELRKPISLKFFIDNSRQVAKNVNKQFSSSLVSNDFKNNDEFLNFSKKLQTLSSSFNEKYFFKDLSNEIKKIKTNNLFFNTYFFLQQSLFHHPFFCKRMNDGSVCNNPVAILLSGFTQCSQASHLAYEFYKFLGFKSKKYKLNNHHICIVYYKNKWRYVDIDYFKAGIYPKNEKGDWLSIDEAQKNPEILDYYPAIGMQISPKSLQSKNLYGETVLGYTDTGLSWNKKFYSCFISKKNIRPPKPIKLKIERIKKKVCINFLEKPDSIFVQIYISKRSRDWNYSDYPDNRFLKKGYSEIYNKKIISDKLSNEILIDLDNPKDNYYLNYVTGYTNKKAYYWPSEEIII